MRAPSDRARGSYRTLGLCAGDAVLEGFGDQSMGVAAPRLVAEFQQPAAESGAACRFAPMGLFVGAMRCGRAADDCSRTWVLATARAFGLCSLATTLAGSADGLWPGR